MNTLTKVFQQQSEEFDKLLADETLPISDLSGELLERAIGTMNYQLKVSLGREPITSPNDAILLTDEDVKQINKIIKDKLKSHNRLSIIKVMKALADELEEEKCDERKVKVFGEYEARTYEDKEMVNAVIQLAIDKINNFINKIK